jgi:regulator of protease activity HflC (stomatin/prohibitin superfamily)
MSEYLFGIITLALLGIIVNAIKILREYERGVIFQLGRFWKVKGPGLIIVIPVVQQIVRVDLRVIVMDVPTQDVISRDNVSVRVNAVVYFRVIDPEKAIIQVEKYLEAVSQLAQTTLRSVLGQHELDDMLAEREEIKHVDLNESMIRAIAAQAEAERQRRAKVIHATGEKQAAHELVEAAKTLSAEPSAIQLRYLQTLTEIAGDQSSTIVFPLDFAKKLKEVID